MNNSWMFAGALLVVAAVPFVLIGAIRFIGWFAPAHVRWVEAIERRYFNAYCVAFGAIYLAIGVAHFMREDGEPIFGAAFSGLSMAFFVRGLRGRHTRSAGDGLTG